MKNYVKVLLMLFLVTFFSSFSKDNSVLQVENNLNAMTGGYVYESEPNNNKSIADIGVFPGYRYIGEFTPGNSDMARMKVNSTTTFDLIAPSGVRAVIVKHTTDLYIATVQANSHIEVTGLDPLTIYRVIICGEVGSGDYTFYNEISPTVDGYTFNGGNGRWYLQE